MDAGVIAYNAHVNKVFQWDRVAVVFLDGRAIVISTPGPEAGGLPAFSTGTLVDPDQIAISTGDKIEDPFLVAIGKSHRRVDLVVGRFDPSAGVLRGSIGSRRVARIDPMGKLSFVETEISHLHVALGGNLELNVLHPQRRSALDALAVWGGPPIPTEALLADTWFAEYALSIWPQNASRLRMGVTGPINLSSPSASASPLAQMT